LADLRVMLSKRGVMSIPACVLKEAEERTQGKAGDNLKMISEAFRGDRSGRFRQGLGSGGRPAKRPAAKRRQKGCRKFDPDSDGEPTTEHRPALPPEHALLFGAYRERAEKHCHGAFRFEVYDLGMMAGHRTNACFWLAFAAGWVSLPQAADASPGTAKAPWTDLLQPAREEVLAWTSGGQANRRVDHDSLGRLADAMRQWFCAKGGYMHGEREKTCWMPSWTEPETPRSQKSKKAGKGLPEVTREASYGKWLEQVAEDGFADELIVSAVSETLRACIVVVPAERRWTVSEYRVVQGGDVSNTVYLGNNNVHFVWLRPRRNDVTPDAAADVTMADDCPILPFAGGASTG
jgi:hypothetical protein